MPAGLIILGTGETRVFGEQFGPTRASRAMAIVHIAIFEVVNAITGRYQSYTGPFRAPKDTSMSAAIAQAAHDTLVTRFPSQTETFDTLLAEDLKLVPNGRGKRNGIDLGQRPLAPRSFVSLSEAEEENGQSRIYLGIHWTFDKSQGIAQGRRVAGYVVGHVFRRR